MMHRTHLRVCLVTCLALALVGCGFANAAGEFTLAEKQKIPRLKQKIDWPDIDQLTGSTLNQQVGAKGPDGKPLLKGIPTSLKKGTLAHISGLLSLAGVCQRSHHVVEELIDPQKDPKGAAAQRAAKKNSPIQDLTVTITNCTGDARCDFVCGGFVGLELKAEVEIQILNELQAANLKKQLSKANPENAADGIVQIRLNFFKFDLYQSADSGTEKEVTTKYLDSLDLILNDAYGEMHNDDGKETTVIQGKEITTIDPIIGTRFEVDPRSEFITNIKARVVSGKATSFRIIPRVRVAKPDLYEMRFDGAGIELDVQPEVVVSVLDAVGL